MIVTKPNKGMKSINPGNNIHQIGDRDINQEIYHLIALIMRFGVAQSIAPIREVKPQSILSKRKRNHSEGARCNI